MACYICGQHIPRNQGYRRYVNTGRSTGVSFGKRITPSVRSYEGVRTLCLYCAKNHDEQSRKSKIISWIFFIGIIFFILIASD